MKKIPYLIIVGEKEVETESVAVRKQGEGDKGTMGLKEFADFINAEVAAQLQVL